MLSRGISYSFNSLTVLFVICISCITQRYDPILRSYSVYFHLLFISYLFTKLSGLEIFVVVLNTVAYSLICIFSVTK